MTVHNYINLELASQDCNVGIVRVAVAAFASQLSFNLNELEDIKIAVSEAVTNSVIHGYPDGRGVVKVFCAIEDNSLKIVISDQGVGIDDVEWAKTATNTTSPERMGLGLYFIEECMDSVTIESAPGAGTTVTMIKHPEGSDAESM
jgi:stage II sporulation protein AB (anti-sigma F factor)